MWVAGALLGLGFLGDAIDHILFENPSEISVVAEVGWTSLFHWSDEEVEKMLTDSPWAKRVRVSIGGPGSGGGFKALFMTVWCPDSRSVESNCGIPRG